MKSKILAIWMCAMLVFSGAVVMIGNGAEAAAVGERPAFSGDGWGSVDEPYIINTTAHLQEMNQDLNAYYVLGQDIDASETVTWPGGLGFDPIGNTTMHPLITFNGSFDGRNHTISNLFINRTGGVVGMFGTISAVGKVTNVTLVNFNVTSTGNYIGTLAGDNKGTVRWVSAHGKVRASSAAGGLIGTSSGILSDCFSAGDVQTDLNNAGGLVGYLSSHVTRCTSSANATAGSHNAGGLVGRCTGNSLQVTDCHAYGAATASLYAGGLIGENFNSIVSNCTAHGQISCTNSVGGGLVGISGGTISDCSASGNVTGYGSMGGLVGQNNGNVIGSNASGTVTVPTADNAGGLVGENTGNITSCQASGDVSGRNSLGGLVGFNTGKVHSCLAYGNVTGELYQGGLVGQNGASASVNRSLSTGSVTGTGRVGGLAGQNLGLILFSHSEGPVTATGNEAGGLAGYNLNTIMNSYSHGSVGGNQYVGGLVGYNDGDIFNSYAMGPVTGNADLGGLAGIDTWVVTDCYYDSDTSGMADVGKGTPKTTIEMMQNATFTGWDFTNIWDIKETYTYPFFLWEQFDSPVIAQDDDFTMDEDSIRTGNVTMDNGFGPDADPDGGPLTVTALNGDPGALMFPTMIPSGAWVTLQQNGTFNYNPSATPAFQALAPGQWAIDSFNYTIKDMNNTFDNATVYVNVTGLNDAPLILNAGQTVTFHEDAPAVQIDSDISITDVDDTHLEGGWVNITANFQQNWDQLEFAGYAGISGTYSIINPNLGSLELSGTDTVANYIEALRRVYFNNTAPNPDINDRTITWLVTDGDFTNIAVTCTVTISDVNDPPVAANDTGTATEDAAFDTVNVTANDSDPELDVLSVSALDTLGTIGTVVYNGDNTFNYDPNGQFDHLPNGGVAYDYFNYTVDDGNGGTDVGMVTVTVNGLNDAPTGMSLTNSDIDENMPVGTAVGTLTTTDPDTGDSFTYAFAAGPGDTDNARFQIVGTQLRSAEIFDYEIYPSLSVRIEVTDLNGGTFSDAFTITVNGINEAPTDITLSNDNIDENEPVGTIVGSFTTVDEDAGDTFTYTLVAGAGDTDNAQFQISGANLLSNAVFDYETKNSYSVRVRTTDGSGATYEESFIITILDVNDPPTDITLSNDDLDENQPAGTAVGTLASTDEDLGESFTYSLVAGTGDADNADFQIAGSELRSAAVFDFEIKNTYNIRVRTTDGSGGIYEEPFIIFIDNVNEAPVLILIGNRAVGEQVQLAFTANAADPDAAAILTFTIEGIPTPPTGAVITTGGYFTWTPTEAQGPGFYNITVRVSDGALFDQETFMVTVSEVNSAPTAADDSATAAEDSGANTINVLANDIDTDVPANTLEITAVTQGAHGTVAITGGGTGLEYTPAPDYFGTDTFTYRVSDGEFNDTATVTVTVINANDDPTAADDAIIVDEDSGANAIPVLVNDGFAPDAGETLTVTAVTQGAHGSVAIAAAGAHITYTPDANFHGADTFTYTISDGNGGTATATVTVMVTNVNDAPVIITANVLTAMAGDEYNVDYTATDIDGDVLTWSLVTTADWLNIDSATGLLNGTAETGTYSIQVTASDGNGGTANTYFTLTVAVSDSDDDGVPDTEDAFPDNPNEWLDTDGDGTGNNADTDDDGDGTPDAEDAFPLDSAESLDTDSDGTGNNADTDDDGDGVADADDPEPLNAAITGNEYDGGSPYWPVVMSILVALIIALICLGIVRYLLRKN